MSTSEKVLSTNDLLRLRVLYNNSDEYTDRNYMNELFHGLDSLIDKVRKFNELCRVADSEYDFNSEVGAFVSLEKINLIIK